MMTSTINLSSGNFEIARSGRRTRRARRADKGESVFDGTKSSNPRITRNWHKFSKVSTNGTNFQTSVQMAQILKSQTITRNWHKFSKVRTLVYLLFKVAR
jgi:hypothetical protein